MFFSYPSGSKPEFPSRRLYSRVTRVEALSTKLHRRISIEFDAIDADIVDDAGHDLRDLFKGKSTKPFALLRTVTTPSRFNAFSGSIPEMGDWYYLEIGQGVGSGLPTWHAQLGENGYVTHSRGNTEFAQRLPSPDEEPPTVPRSVGAAAVRPPTLPSSVAELCRIPSGAITSKYQVTKLLKSVGIPTAVVIRDVGQASFATFSDGTGKSLLHFDVGIPISFNKHTFPKQFSYDASETPIIVLSHWDWDHLHGAHLFPHLCNCKWVVPDQHFGPGAARLAIKLAGAGNLYVWPATLQSQFPFGRVGKCGGSAGNPNDTGLALRSRLKSSRSVLLTGDADYQALPILFRMPVAHLVATHHGARFHAADQLVPRPTSSASTLVLSFGSRNCYRHPNADALKVYSKIGWLNQLSTAGIKGHYIRGDRSLS